MSLSLGKKISLLSKGLRYLCFLGIVLFPVLNVFYWLLDLPAAGYMQFSDAPYINVAPLSLNMRLMGFAIDLVPCTLMIGIFLLSIKVLNQYERLRFFSKKNSRYIRWIALILFFRILISPFYLGLRSYLFTPSEPGLIIPLFGLSDFKMLLAVLGILLVAYITEVARKLDEELKTVV